MSSSLSFRKRLFAEKALDLANLALGASGFSQFVSDAKFSWIALLFGVLFWATIQMIIYHSLNFRRKI